MVKIACCWDDAPETDIQLVEILRKYGIKATFNINSGLHYRSFRRRFTWQFADYPSFDNRLLALDEMPDLYQGFKIGVHGVFHCNYVPDNVREFMVDMLDDRKFLEDFFQCSVPGMAYPCGRYDAGVAQQLLDAGFAYGRTCDNTWDVAAFEHPLMLRTSAHFQAPDFLDRFYAARENNGIFYFWGHSCEMQDDSRKWQEFERRMKVISEDPEAEFIDVIDIVKKDI